MTTPSAGSLLIVDDEASVRRALERLLRKEGYNVQSASGAADASKILDQDSIDVILCDQDMPGKTGIEFLLEAAQKYPNQRRLMISGRFQSRDVAEAMDAGAIHKFMMKPWDDAILKADIRASFRQIMKEFAVASQQSTDQATPSSANNDPASDQSWAQFDQDRKLSRELHSAANDGSLSLAYQPQVRLLDEKITGFEALLRWTSTSGPVGPDHFIALAERGGSMSKLTHWVIREVFHQAQQWTQNWEDSRIGLNVSPIDLRDDTLLEHLECMLERYPISPNSLQIEVTESQALDSDDAMKKRLCRISDLGFTLAIDDFGAGATTLSYLADLPFTTLKLDRSLTLQMTEPKGYAVVQKVLEMAQCLGMKTTVEGIETAEHAELARALGADTAQGYYYSKPRAEAVVHNWITNGSSGALQ